MLNREADKSAQRVPGSCLACGSPVEKPARGPQSARCLTCRPLHRQQTQLVAYLRCALRIVARRVHPGSVAAVRAALHVVRQEYAAGFDPLARPEALECRGCGMRASPGSPGSTWSTRRGG